MPTKEELITWYEGLRSLLREQYNIDLENPKDVQKVTSVNLNYVNDSETNDLIYVFADKKKDNSYVRPIPFPERDDLLTLSGQYDEIHQKDSQRNLQFEYEDLKRFTDAVVAPVKRWMDGNIVPMQPASTKGYSQKDLSRMESLYKLAQSGNLFLEDNTGLEGNRMDNFRQVYIDGSGNPKVTPRAIDFNKNDLASTYDGVSREQAERLAELNDRYGDGMDLRHQIVSQVISAEERVSGITKDNFQFRSFDVDAMIGFAFFGNTSLKTIEEYEADFEKVKAAYEKTVDLGPNVLMDETTFKAYDDYIAMRRLGPELEEYEKCRNMIDRSDFTDYQQISVPLKNYFATLEFKKLDFSGDISAAAMENAINPFFRRALRIASQSLDLPEAVREKASAAMGLADETAGIAPKAPAIDAQIAGREPEQNASLLRQQMGRSHYRPGQQFKELSESLERHKHSFMKIDLGDSPLMADVKRKLADVVRLTDDPNASLADAYSSMEKLLQATERYKGSTKKADNDRMKIVKSIDRYAEDEFRRITGKMRELAGGAVKAEDLPSRQGTVGEKKQDQPVL